VLTTANPIVPITITLAVQKDVSEARASFADLSLGCCIE
jgi:hypothetical protein